MEQFDNKEQELQHDLTETTADEVADAAETSVAEETPKQTKKAKLTKKRINTRKLRYGTTATVLTAVVVAALVLVSVIADVLSDRFPLNIDLTKDNTYTFTEDSKEVAKLVDRDVEIVAFMNEDTFKNPSYSEEENIVVKQFYEFTKQYNALTDGKVTVTYVDTTNNPTAFAAYEEYEIEDAGAILLRTKDRYRKITLDDLFETEINYNTYQQEVTGSNVEKVLASNIQFLCRDAVSGITILTGHDEYEMASNGAYDLLNENGYDVTYQNFSTAEELPKNTKALVIAAPSKDYNADEIARLRTWLNNDEYYGRHLMVLLHPTADCPNLYEFLKEEYYIEVGDNLVVETELENVFYGYSTPSYYAYADYSAGDYTAGLDGRLVMSGCRQITALIDNDEEAISRVEPIIYFSDSAKYVKILDENDDSDTELETIDPEDSVYGGLMSIYNTYNNDLQTEVLTKVMVIGAADFLTEGVADYNSTTENKGLFVNVINGTLGNEEAIALGTHSIQADTLEYSVTMQLVLGMGVFTVGIPVVMLIICLVVFIKRRHL